jgi:hypothetical protein
VVVQAVKDMALVVVLVVYSYSQVNHFRLERTLAQSALAVQQ